MKQVQAILRPEKLDAVKDALVELGVHGMTVIPVEGFGKQLGHPQVYRGVKVEARFLRKVLVMVAVTDAMLPALVETIRQIRCGSWPGTTSGRRWGRLPKCSRATASRAPSPMPASSRVSIPTIFSSRSRRWCSR